jgi:hypothetical protein
MTLMSTATIEIIAPHGIGRLDDDVRFDLGIDGSTGPAYMALPTRNKPAVGSATNHEAPATPRSKVLPRLLAMADAYLEEGSMRSAQEMYFDLAQSYPGTPQAEQAEARLFEVARRYERAGELRLARALYEQLV